MWENMGLPFREAKYRIKEEGLFPSLTYAGAARKSHLAQQNITPQQKRQQQQQEEELQQEEQQKQQESRNQTLDDIFHSINDQGDKTFIGSNTVVTPTSKIFAGD